MQIWRLRFHLWVKQAGHVIAQGWMKKKLKAWVQGKIALWSDADGDASTWGTVKKSDEI